MWNQVSTNNLGTVGPILWFQCRHPWKIPIQESGCCIMACWQSAVKWVLNNVLLTSVGHKHEKFAPKCAVKWGRAGWQMWDHVDGFGGHLHQKVVSDTEAFSLALFNKHSLRPEKDGASALDACLSLCLSSLTNIHCENMKGQCTCHLDKENFVNKYLKCPRNGGANDACLANIQVNQEKSVVSAVASLRRWEFAMKLENWSAVF